MKKFNSNLYTIEKYKRISHRLRRITNDDGFVYAVGIYLTKIKETDLPEWYVYGRYYKCFGYLSAKGVVDLKYEPNLFTNHFLKDDFLYISYNGKITVDCEARCLYSKYKGYDEHICGNYILSFFKAVHTYSNYDISQIIVAVKEKVEWLKMEYDDEFFDFSFDADKYFNEDKT